jgi:hypothetical protein
VLVAPFRSIFSRTHHHQKRRDSFHLLSTTTRVVTPLCLERRGALAKCAHVTATFARRVHPRGGNPAVNVNRPIIGAGRRDGDGRGGGSARAHASPLGRARRPRCDEGSRPHGATRDETAHTYTSPAPRRSVVSADACTGATIAWTINAVCVVRRRRPEPFSTRERRGESGDCPIVGRGTQSSSGTLHLGPTFRAKAMPSTR